MLEAFDKHGVPVDLISNSETGVSVTIDEKLGTVPLMDELKAIGKVEAKSNRARVSLVGSDLRYMTGALETMYSSLKSIGIEMIPSSTSDKNKSVVIEGRYTDRAVKKLHNTFFSR